MFLVETNEIMIFVLDKKLFPCDFDRFDLQGNISSSLKNKVKLLDKKQEF